MVQIPTLCPDYRECLLDINIYGQIVSTPRQSLEELTESLWEEFKQKKPMPSLEHERYKLSRLVNPDYRIEYNKELELKENESLVDLNSAKKSFRPVDFTDLQSLIPEVMEKFSYESNITDDLRQELIEKYDLETGEEFKPGIKQTEDIAGTVTEDMSLRLSDEEIDNLGREETINIDEGVEVDEITIEGGVSVEEIPVEVEEIAVEEDIPVEETLAEEEIPVEEDDSADDFFDSYNDEDDSDSADDFFEGYENNEEDSEEEEIPVEEEIPMDEDDSADDFFEGYENEDDTDANEFFEGYAEDETSVGEDYEGDDFEGYAEEISEQSVIETEKAIQEEIPVDINDEEDFPIEDFIEEPIVNKPVETPVTPAQIHNEVKKEEPVDRSSEPTDIRAFLRKHPRCEYDFALKYFTKKQLNDAIKVGKIVKKGSILKI